ncbi:unnamed protein product [Arabis nemorensis]|uniref:Uncharacterized protein n=1 Tax=Arabis nemorensis TaxID=586526 RepID=A0A565BKY8_9BRAS|nr:unnamed protein product [Arabis nemorensis]
MAKKQNKKPVEQPPNEEEEQVSMEEKCEELLKTPPSTGQQASDSETEKIVSTKEVAESSADVASTKTKKRPVEESSSGVNGKRLKTEEKKPMFQRIWSLEDEIVLLESIIKFGKDPLKDKTGSFHHSVKSLIQFEVSNSQVITKIQNMRKKYLGKAHKAVVRFSKPHDRLCFEKSEEIWGPNGILEKKVDDDVMSEEDEWFENSFLPGSVASDCLCEGMVKRGWNLVQTERKHKIQKKLKVLEKEYNRIAFRKKEFINDITSAIYEVTS